MLRGANLRFSQAMILRQHDLRLKPELCLTIWALNMHMNSRLFAGEKVKPKAAVAENRRTHQSHPMFESGGT